MNLIPIPRDGSVRLSGVTLPEVAMSVIAPTVQMYERRGYVEPWVGYLAIEGGKCVGTCGFTSPPVGEVAEIAYFTFPDFEKRGIATRMAQRLISIAQECDPAVKIIAQWLPYSLLAGLAGCIGSMSWARSADARRVLEIAFILLLAIGVIALVASLAAAVRLAIRPSSAYWASGFPEG